MSTPCQSNPSNIPVHKKRFPFAPELEKIIVHAALPISAVWLKASTRIIKRSMGLSIANQRLFYINALLNSSDNEEIVSSFERNTQKSICAYPYNHLN